jgi:hypothetical protein
MCQILLIERSIAHGVLDRPVEPGDDTAGFLWSPNPKAVIARLDRAIK